MREELAGQGVPTVSICSSKHVRAAKAAIAASARVVIGDVTAPATWEEAGIGQARSVGILGEDDLANLSAALQVADDVPDVPIVVRLFATDLAEGVEQILQPRGTVLSEIEVSAPALIQAALSGNEGQRVTISGRILEVSEVDKDDPGLVVALCDVEHPLDVLPARDQLPHHVLGLVDRAQVVKGARGALPASVAQRAPQRAKRPSTTERARAAMTTIPRRAYLLLATIVVVFSIGTSVFAISQHLDVIDSMYFTATTMATVGYGDVNLLTAPDWLKLFDIGLMAVSAVLLASVLAFVTDQLVSSRIDRALGRFPRPRKDHVIVCGLGKAGARVIEGLHALGVPCVGVERNPEAVGIEIARRLEIPVVFADGRSPGTLQHVHVDQARAVMALTSDDLVNLECALSARKHNPKVRLVMRIFDPRLAERLDRGIELDITRSVSALAAPSFSAALLGRTPAQPLSLSNVPLRVLETRIPHRWPHAGARVRDLHAGNELRVLAIDGKWFPRDDIELLPGQAVSVVATKEACDALTAR
ncbi:NAD-binding protein [Solirubrobacter soli]|uniref:NAD-binding protein n=1 Tax=Solirubrobacter soli TaxID=363832 RepID=UPI001B7FC3A3|nr:NAD-binding protein [Solirubrobacter soli]